MAKRIRLFVVFLLIVGLLGVWAYRRWSTRVIQRSEVALLNAELAYTSQLADGLGRIQATSDRRSLSLLLSSQVIAQILDGLVGAKIRVDAIDGHVTVGSVTTLFRDGFPEVELVCAVDSARTTASLKVRVAATIEPHWTSAHPDVLELAVRPLEIHAVAEVAGVTAGLSQESERILTAVLAQLAERAPRASVPIASRLVLAVPASSVPVQVPTGNGRLNGTVALPAVSADIPLAITQLYFLTDGIHVVMSTDEKAPRLLPFDIPPPPDVAADQLPAAIAERRAAIEQRRHTLAPLVASAKIPDAGVAIDVGTEFFNSLFAPLNNAAAPNRTVTYTTNSEDGQLYRTGAGGAGCGGYANLVGGNSALSSAPDSWLSYSLVLVSPTTVPITVEAGLGQLGTVGVPISFELPKDPLMAGKAPPLVGTHGEAKAPLDNAMAPRGYDIKVIPTSGAVTAQGFRMKANATIAWQPK